MNDQRRQLETCRRHEIEGVKSFAKVRRAVGLGEVGDNTHPRLLGCTYWGHVWTALGFQQPPAAISTVWRSGWPGHTTLPDNAGDQDRATWLRLWRRLTVPNRRGACLAATDEIEFDVGQYSHFFPPFLHLYWLLADNGSAWVESRRKPRRRRTRADRRHNRHRPAPDCAAGHEVKLVIAQRSWLIIGGASKCAEKFAHE
jgi:hypothetical protein